MEGLVNRIAALEGQAVSSTAIAKDFRVIDMHLARAEDKIMRQIRSSCTRTDINTFLTEDV